MYYVYQYIDPRNNIPFYIGKGNGDRMYSHLQEDENNTINKNKFNKIRAIINAGLHPIIQKIKSFDNEEDAYNFETELIKTYGRKGIDVGGILTNVTIGNNPPPQKGRKWSAEQCYKHHLKMLEVAKMRVYESSIPWNKGLKGCQVPWNKNLVGIAGHTHSHETKQKLRDMNIGKQKSLETREKMSKNMKGRIPWNKGKTLNTTTATAIKCTFVSPVGEHYDYHSLRQGCIFHNLPTSKMSDVKNGKIPHYKEWTLIINTGVVNE